MSQLAETGLARNESPKESSRPTSTALDAPGSWALALMTLGLSVATLVLMTMGSLVHGTGSSLACPDWPLCNGHVFPRMIGGVEFEHTHRLIALGVVLVCGAVALRVRQARPSERWLPYLGCGILVVQALLGALTVVLRLPPAVSIAHLATSMTFLSLTLVLGARLAPIAPPASLGGARTWLGAAVVAVFAQIVLGAVVRHLGAALACPGVPLCAGTSLPNTDYGWVHMAHRSLGLVATGFAAFAAVRARGLLRAPGQALYRKLALVPAVLVCAQMFLGLGVVLTGAPLEFVTLHHTCGALLLGSLVLVWALSGIAARSASPTSHRAVST